jgi:hypothetical protein
MPDRMASDDSEELCRSKPASYLRMTTTGWTKISFLMSCGCTSNLLDNYLLTLATPPSGPTASRPTTNLAVGDYYFDTDLNLPIYYDGTDWIDAAGNVV